MQKSTFPRKQKSKPTHIHITNTDNKLKNLKA